MFEWYGSKHRDVWKVLKVSIEEKQISDLYGFQLSKPFIRPTLEPPNLLTI